MALVDYNDIYLKQDLDILFIALNPPVQSNNNGHYFSGGQSTFFKQLYMSGLITRQIDKKTADEYVFGENNYNYKNKNYGVIDLLPCIVETNSESVKAKGKDIIVLINKIKEYKPKNVCVIHSKVKKSFEKITKKELKYGYNGIYINDLNTQFYCNYFPNGNNITTDTKVQIFTELLNRL